MFLSRLKIKNFRSISDIDITFSPGKNIVIGKNNAGKSNVLRAIDILLGDYKPDYSKTENITLEDFHDGKVDEPIYIFGELKRDDSEALNFDEIKKSSPFNLQAAGKYPNIQLVRHSFSEENFFSHLDACLNIFPDADGIQKLWIGEKSYCKMSFESFFADKFSFAFAFRAYCDDQDKVQKDLRFFIRENNTQEWFMAFSASIRNELLQSAVIPSFRDPQSQLRINQWSWFGKLLKTTIKGDDPGLLKAFHSLKKSSNRVFKELQSAINHHRVKVAFPGTNVTFQFNPESKLDVYKSTLIYVDDGHLSQLQNKGAGIQSAVIIGLFHYYTEHVAHVSSSLLAIEEPELYLHPQAKRVIASRIDDFLASGQNQVILTTHSPEFLTATPEDLNVILACKDGIKTTCKTTSFVDPKEKQLLYRSNNNEMFFSDGVILVEGGEKFILSQVAKVYGSKIKTLGKNWLDEKNISLIAVGGKTEFWKYYKKLRTLGIPVFIVADFDFLLRKLNEFITKAPIDRAFLDGLNKMKTSLAANIDLNTVKRLSQIPRKFRRIVKEYTKTLYTR